MIGRRAGERPRFSGPLAASVVLHLAAAGALIAMRPNAPRATAPLYRVNIVAAPPGERAPGVVAPRPPAPTSAPTPPPARAEAPTKEMPAPPTKRPPPAKTPPPAATPTPTQPTKAPAVTDNTQRAGGGPTGGRGTDVATVRTEGIEFPYPGYLSNIVRQIALRFKPDNPSAALRAEVMFLIRRDGSVTDIRLFTRSGNYAFDLDAVGAVEAAAHDNVFGPLPTGFPDDVLPVIFSFDPRVLR